MKQTKPALILKSLQRDFAAIRQTQLETERKLQAVRTARALQGKTLSFKLEV